MKQHLSFAQVTYVIRSAATGIEQRLNSGGVKGEEKSKLRSVFDVIKAAEAAFEKAQSAGDANRADSAHNEKKQRDTTRNTAVTAKRRGKKRKIETFAERARKRPKRSGYVLEISISGHRHKLHFMSTTALPGYDVSCDLCESSIAAADGISETVLNAQFYMCKTCKEPPFEICLACTRQYRH